MREELKLKLAEKSCRIDKAMRDFWDRETQTVPNLHDAALYALGLDQDDPAIRGKRLRPALCLMVCEALGGCEENAMPFALGIEMVHNFFLIHDDIEDGDAYRRGRPSVWKKYGLAHGINIGDFLYTKVWSLFLALEDSLDIETRMAQARLLTHTVEYTIMGQALEMNARQSRDITLDSYLEIVGHKTAHYLAAPIVSGAMIANASDETITALRDFGRHVGPVFQVIDDMIDLTEGKGREAIGSDIREGKRSFLVAHAAQQASGEDREKMFDILDKPREETTDDDVQWVKALFQRTGSTQAGSAFCREQMDLAHATLSPIDKNLRSMLSEIFESLLERKK